MSRGSSSSSARTAGQRPGRGHLGKVGTVSPFAARMQAMEDQFLAPEAARSYPADRVRPELDSPIRTPFQRDRDRIVHSKSFRRLSHKTQVFVAPTGDHYRTRFSHTLEVCVISRTVARALALNEDLTEAIGVGHDLGHPPFGHVGEETLDAILREDHGGSFHHNEHSLRLVEVLEHDGAGLNLTAPVRDGILNHTGPGMPETLEGRIVRLVDRVAYLNHDIDDALRAGALRLEELPPREIELLGSSGASRIDTLVLDIIENSQGAGDIVQSEEIGAAMSRLRDFMFSHVYFGQIVCSEHTRIKQSIRSLFSHYLAHPEEMPEWQPDLNRVRQVTDYIAGMTDRYCLTQFAELQKSEGQLVGGLRS